MNNLNIVTRRIGVGSSYDVYWNTGSTKRGLLQVQLPSSVTDDGYICAELVAIQHLLEDKNVCGHDKGGRNLRITVSSGAIRKLCLARSGKPHLVPYANFLKTRFLGAEIRVDNRAQWASDGFPLNQVGQLVVSGPRPTTIGLGQIGEAVLTAHAVERYTKRFGVIPYNGWRKMAEWGPHCTEMVGATRTWRQLLRYPKQCRFFLNAGREMILVVMPPKGHETLPAVVTVYPIPQERRSAVIRQFGSCRSYKTGSDAKLASK